MWWFLVLVGFVGPVSHATEVTWQVVRNAGLSERVRAFGLDSEERAVAVTDHARWRWRDGAFHKDERYIPPPIQREWYAIPRGSEDVWVGAKAYFMRWRDGAWDEEKYGSAQVNAPHMSFSSADDGWAGGYRDVLEHWNGERWTQVPDAVLPTGGVGAITRVLSVSPTDAWFFFEPTRPPMRFDGTAFRRVPKLPWHGEDGGPRADGVYVACADPETTETTEIPTRVMVTGAEYAAWWNGRSWELLDPENNVVTCAADDETVWVAGDHGYIARWDGVSLQPAPTATQEPIRGLVFDGDGTGFAFTSNGTVLRTAPSTEISLRDRLVIDDTRTTATLALNRDLLADLVVLNENKPARLYENTGGLELIDVSRGMGLPSLNHPGTQIEVCDLDGDGDSDMLSWSLEQAGLTLLRNVRNGRYRSIPQPDGPEGPVTGVRDIDCVDLDADGDLDVYLTNIHRESSTPIRNLVYENVGFGRLTLRVPAARGLGGHGGWSMGAEFVDLRAGPAPELVAVNAWRPTHRVLSRADDGRWHDMTLRSGLAAHQAWGREATSADIEGDGDVDLLIQETHGRSYFYLNDDGRLGEHRVLGGRPLQRGIANDHHLLEMTLVDLDGDERSEIIAPSEAGARVYLQELSGDETPLAFRDISDEVGTLVGGVDSVSVGDFDADGDWDLYLGRRLAQNRRFENTTEYRGRLIAVRSWSTNPANARVELLATSGQTLATRWVPREGLPVLLPPAAGPGEHLKVRFSTGREQTIAAPNGSGIVRLERGIPGAVSWLRYQLQSRVAWMYWPEELARGVVFVGVVGPLIGLGWRRRTMWYGSVLALPALAAAYTVLVFATTEWTMLYRSMMSVGFLVLLAIGSWVDLVRTRDRQAKRIGPFRLERKLGAGGMGTVYLARDLAERRRVALKVMHPKLMDKDIARRRFRREAELGAQFDHPNLVRVYSNGECTVFDGDAQESTCYLAMEWVRGRSLDAWLVEASPMSSAQACRVGVEILDAVQVLHDGGVVHRDLKPGNVLIGEDGQVKVTDYGLARAGGATMTQTGALLGTLCYIAPELTKGPATSPAGDIWAVGAIVYEMLAGRLAFAGDDLFGIMQSVLNEEPTSLLLIRPNLPVPVVHAIERALEKDPYSRWRRASDFAAALRPYASPAVDTMSFPSADRPRQSPEGPRPAQRGTSTIDPEDSAAAERGEAQGEDDER